MATGKIHHWKHGWIPLDSTALAERKPKIETGHVIKSPHSTAPKITKVWQKPTGELTTTDPGYGAPAMKQVEGAPDVAFIDHSVNDGSGLGDWRWGWTNLTADQKRKVAPIVQEVSNRFPGLKKKPVIVDGIDTSGDAWAITAVDPEYGHKISVDTNIFNTPKANEAIAEWKNDHGSLSGVLATNVDSFRKNVITHEVGHVMQLREMDRAHPQWQRVPTGGMGNGVSRPFMATDKFSSVAWEKKTPHQMGWDETVAAPAISQRMISEDMDFPYPRWMLDPLRDSSGTPMSAYATTDPAEFVAEAFLDGYLNGDKASESGRRILAVAKDLYGGSA